MDRFDFAVGDRLLLYSDGVLDTRDREGRFFDLPVAVAELIEAPSVEAVVDGLLDALSHHAPLLPDDVALLAVERLAAPMAEAAELRRGHHWFA